MGNTRIEVFVWEYRSDTKEVWIKGGKVDSKEYSARLQPPTVEPKFRPKPMMDFNSVTKEN
jgi:hypothetical protein